MIMTEKTRKAAAPVDQETKALSRLDRELNKFTLSDAAKSRVLDTLQRRYAERKSEPVAQAN
jgi:hypothetical protein